MKKISLPLSIRNCLHCKSKKSVIYYREDSQTNCDLYYCKKCFGLFIWDAHQLEKIGGEAYPDRDKL